MRKIKKYFKNHWIRLVLCIAYGIIIVLSYNALRNNYVSLVDYSNGLFIAGGTLVLFGLLVLVSYFGGMDIFSYTFTKKKIVDGKRETLYDYSERKKVERKPSTWVFVDYLVIGALYILASGIILIILK